MVSTNNSRQNAANQRWLTEYYKRFSGKHTRSTIRVVEILHFYNGLPDGARPSIDTIATEAGVSRRTVNAAVKALRADGLVKVEERDDGHGRPLPNLYVLEPVSGHKPRSSDVQFSARYPAKKCTGYVPLTEDSLGLQEDLEDQEDLGIGLDLPSVGVPPVGGSPTTTQGENQGGQRKNVFTQRTSVLGDCKKPLADPVQEHLAEEIVALLDKLNVRHGARPLSPGSRPGQLTSARLLVAHDRVSGAETLDAIRWAFSGQSGARKWARKLTKPFELRRHHTGLLEAYRKALVSDISGGDPEPEPYRQPERTPEEQAELSRRIRAHR